MSSNSADYPYVIIRVVEQQLAISARNVRAMVAMPPLAVPPQKPPWVRGVINLRGKVISLIDLRVRLGMTSYLTEIDELIHVMEEREKDHKNWLQELENALREDREFKLATDPHKCAFGKWYDSYKAKNTSMEEFLKQFVRPHEKIHDIAHEAISLKKSQGLEAAQALLEKTREGDLSKMIVLFQRFRRMVRELTDLEIAVVIDDGEESFALAVDSIESVEMLKEDSIEPVSELFASQDSALLPFVGKRKTADQLVLILDEKQLFATSDSPSLRTTAAE